MKVADEEEMGYFRQERRHRGPTTVQRNFESDVRWSKAGPVKGSITKTSCKRNSDEASNLEVTLTSSPWMKVTVLVGDTLSTEASSTQAGAMSASLHRLKASLNASDTLVSSRPSGMTNLELIHSLSFSMFSNMICKRQNTQRCCNINFSNQEPDGNIIVLTIKILIHRHPSPPSVAL